MLPIDSLKEIQNAWVDMLLRFRSWYFPETALTKEWKFRALSEAIRSCRATLMDDAEGMLVAYRKNPNDGEAVGSSAFLPVMLTATASVDMPPDASQLMGMPYLTDVCIHDKMVRMRVIPTAVRAQMAFFATNPHDARSMAGQFCAYMSDDWNRKIDVPFVLGDGVRDKFKFIVFDNNLMPNAVPSEALNISIFTVDVTLVGYVPQVLGLGLDGEHAVNMGYTPDGTPGKSYDPSGKPIDHSDSNDPNNPNNPINRDLVVVQADQFDDHHTRVLAEKDNGSITVQQIRD